MNLRLYQPDDCLELIALFKDTIHRINARDYAADQIAAWADAPIDQERWNARFLSSHTLVAVSADEIIGFANMSESGYLDCLYVHADHQREGAASALCEALESACPIQSFFTEASITAVPFFKARGYRIARKQTVIRYGTALTNFVMEKS